MLAIGNGQYAGALGLIADAQTSGIGLAPPGSSAWWKWFVTLTGVVGAAALAYHGYSRTRSAPVAICWGILGAIFPANLVAGGVAASQGFGKRRSRKRS